MGDGGLATALSGLGAYLPQVTAVGFCLLLLAFCSLSEAALVRVTPGRARQWVEEGRRGARGLERLVANRQRVLSSLVLLINVSVIVVAAYTTSITIGLSGGSERWVPLASLAMILVILVVCEVAPKTYGVHKAEAVAGAVAPLVSFLHVLARPFANVLYLVAMWVIRRLVVPVFGGEAVAGSSPYSDAEVLAIVSAGEAEGDVEAEEKEMIQGVIEFAETVAREVMTPRTDMACVPAEATLLEAARISGETGYSRLPVYEGDVDHIIGILYAKDMVSALERDGASLTAAETARKPPPVVPESKKVSEVLHLMQRNRLHMAVVIDEYGGTAGLVTIEDLLEEIFGELRDEYDVEAEPVHVVSETVLVLDARVSTDEVEDQLGVALPEGDFDSVGGFILDQLGRLPTAGEKLAWRNLEFTVEAVGENRILKVRVEKRPEEGGDEEAPE